MVSYTGEVKPGGPADTRELSGLTITKVAVDPEMSNNAYLLRCNATGDQVLIDAAAEPDDAAATDRRRRADRRRDHPPALGPPPRARRRWWPRPEPPSSSGRRTPTRSPSRPGCRSTGGSGTATRSPSGECTLEVIAIAGHTPGSIALLYDDPSGHPHLFTGDSLFPGGPGRTTTSGGLHVAHGRPGVQALRPAPRRAPGSTPATATTRPSAPSGLISASGASGAGRPSSRRRTAGRRRAGGSSACGCGRSCCRPVDRRPPAR